MNAANSRKLAAGYRISDQLVKVNGKPYRVVPRVRNYGERPYYLVYDHKRLLGRVYTTAYEPNDPVWRATYDANVRHHSIDEAIEALVLATVVP